MTNHIRDALAAANELSRYAASQAAQREKDRRDAERLRSALETICSKLRASGATLPAPEIKGTIESSMLTGLSIALCIVESEFDAARAAGAQDARP